MSTSSEPPSLELSSYNREEIVATLRDFYEFLSKLPWLESGDILYPPESGWPNITKENFAFLGKNEEVIALLRHLPYIRMDGKGQYVVAYNTFPCDYRRDYFQSPAFEKGLTPWEIPETGGRFEFPSWVVPLTYGKNHGDYLMLDTTDGGFFVQSLWCFTGTVTRFQVTGGGYPPEYPADDPRSWRNECEPAAERLAVLLAKWRENYENLNWIGFPRAGWPNIWDEEDEGFKVGVLSLPWS
jgi:hypothetical protein